MSALTCPYTPKPMHLLAIPLSSSQGWPVSSCCSFHTGPSQDFPGPCCSYIALPSSSALFRGSPLQSTGFHEKRCPAPCAPRRHRSAAAYIQPRFICPDSAYEAFYSCLDLVRVSCPPPFPWPLHFSQQGFLIYF